ncbi:MAG: hypothetical protein LBK60_12870 [Verrucomicrobiales bacterium]|nr:hypothetical protein [Verrucomicrobiales bacterium]
MVRLTGTYLAIPEPSASVRLGFGVGKAAQAILPVFCQPDTGKIACAALCG